MLIMLIRKIKFLNSKKNKFYYKNKKKIKKKLDITIIIIKT